MSLEGTKIMGTRQDWHEDPARTRRWFFSQPNRGFDQVCEIKRCATPNVLVEFINFSKRSSFSKIIDDAMSMPDCQLGYKQLFQNRPSAPPSKYVATDLVWLGNKVLNVSTKIQEFTQKRVEFGSYLLLADYNSAKTTLNAINSRFGYSLWALEKDFMLASLSADHERRSTLLAELQNKDVPYFTRLFASLLSLRTESDISSTYYRLRIKRELRRIWKEDDPALWFTLFHADPLHYETRFDPKPVLWYTQYLNVIDQYLAFTKITRQFAVESPRTVSGAIFRALITKLSTYVKDPPLTRLRQVLFEDFEDFEMGEQDKQLSELLDQYTAGHYEKAVSSGIEIIKKMPLCITPYEIVARSAAYKGESPPLVTERASLADNILKVLYKLYHNGIAASQEAETLRLIITRLGDNHLAYALEAAVQDEAYENDSEVKGADKHAYLLSRLANPYCRAMERQTVKKLIENYRKLFPSSVSAYYLDLKVRGTLTDVPRMEGVDSIRWNISLAEEFLGKQPEKTLFLLDEIEVQLAKNHSTIPICLQAKCSSLRFKCLISTDQIEESLDLFVRTYLSARLVAQKFPVAMLLSNLGYADRLKTQIQWLILRAVIATTPKEVYIAVDDFFEACNLRCPTELIRRKEFNINYVQYIICKVLTSEVLAKGLYCRSLKDVYVMRLRLLNELGSAGITLGGEQRQEIAQINKALFNMRACQKKSKSRISINVPNVKVRINEAVCKGYVYYLTLAGNSENNKPLTIEIETLGTQEKPNDVPEYKPELSRAVNYMLFEGVSVFLFDQNVGLDVILSNNVRHGKIGPEMRRELLAEDLLAIRTKDNYSISRALQTMLDKGRADRPSQEKLKRIVEEFTKRCDQMIDLLVSEFMQIKWEVEQAGSSLTKRTGKRDGLFDFRRVVDEVNKALGLVENTKIVGVDEIVDELMVACMNSLSVSLKAVQQHLEDKFVPSLMDLIDNLAHEVRGIGLTSECEIDIESRITRVRTELDFRVKRIAKWFNPGSPVEFDSFNLAELVENVVHDVGQCAPDGLNKCKTEIDSDVYLKGKYFDPLYDLVFILVHNIIEHAVAFCDGICAEISLNCSEDVATLSVCNTFPNGVNISENYKLANDLLATAESDLPYVAQEGHSGFRKVYRILKHDLGEQKPRIRIENNPVNVFCVIVDIPLRLEMRYCDGRIVG